MVKIEKDKFYRPRDIARFQLIKSSRGKCSYNFVLDEIASGNLKAENKGQGKTPYFWVKGSEILKYRKEHNLFFGDEGAQEAPKQE